MIINNFKNQNTYDYNNELIEEKTNSNKDNNEKFIEDPIDELNKIVSTREIDLEIKEEINNNPFINSIDKKNLGKINPVLISYKFNYAMNDKNIKLPVNVYFGCRKYYLMNKKKI